MIPLINLGSDKRSWVAPLSGWTILTAVGTAAYGFKIGSFWGVFWVSPLIAILAAFAAFWPTASFLAAHNSDRPFRRLLLALFAIAALFWSAWAMAEVMLSFFSTASIGLALMLAAQGLMFFGAYLAARILDWIADREKAAK